MNTRTIGFALLLIGGAAQADLSANLGFASEYHYRGILQKSSSASAGFDYEQGGFYGGTWVADVGDGLEIDGYFGYGAELGKVSLSAGFTGYYYTGDFDDTYQEINLGAGFGLLSLDVAVGEYDNFDGPTLDYTFYSLSVEKNGFSATLGSFGENFDGDYLQLGYDTTISEIDFGVALIFANDDLVGNKEESVICTVGKSFDIK